MKRGEGRYQVRCYASSDLDLPNWYIEDTEPTGKVYPTHSTTTVARFWTYAGAVIECDFMNERHREKPRDCGISHAGTCAEHNAWLRQQRTEWMKRTEEGGR